MVEIDEEVALALEGGDGGVGEAGLGVNSVLGGGGGGGEDEEGHGGEGDGGRGEGGRR